MATTNLSPCKPSIQKLVTAVAHDAIVNLAEETTRTDAYLENAPQAKMTVDALKAELSADLIDDDLLSEALHKSIARSEARERKYGQTVSVTRRKRDFYKVIVDTDIGYRRDCSPTYNTRKYWADSELGKVADTVPVAIHSFNPSIPERTSPQRCRTSIRRSQTFHQLHPKPTSDATGNCPEVSVCIHWLKSVLNYSHRGIIKLMNMIKMRTYSRTSNDLWLDEWRSPIAKYVSITSDPDFRAYLSRVPSIKDE
jgi:proteasome activator subunit 4